MGKAAFILPGGVGIIEGTITALYTGLGVPNGTTVAVVLIYRFLSFWLPTLIGFLLMPIGSVAQRVIENAPCPVLIVK